MKKLPEVILSTLVIVIYLISYLVIYPVAKAKPQLSKSFRPYWVETLFQFENYYSTGNYNTSGKAVNLPSSNSFWASTGFDFAGRYVFSHRLAATTSLNHISAQANQATITRYNSGFQTLKGGIEYKIPTSYADYVAEGVIQLSLYKPNENTDLPLYGDGAQALGGNFSILQKFNALYWHGKAGLLFRSDGLSSLFPYQIGLHWKINSWTFSSVLEGAWSISPDTIGDTKRTNYLRRSNAGSMIYRSANPNSNFLDFQLKYDVTNQFGFNGGIGSSLFGRNSSNGNRYYVGIDIHWQPILTPSSKTPLKNTMPSMSSDHDEGDLDNTESTPFSL